jgi:hypothetical protein
MENQQVETPKLSHLESTPPPPITPPITPPKKPKALILILSLTTLLSLSAAGYLYYQNYSLIASTPIIETPPTTNDPQPPIESTVSWLSYTLGNYQFKLPPHLTPETQYDDFFFAASTQINGLKINLDLGAGIGFQCIEKIATENINALNKTVILETYQGMKPEASIACDTDTSNHFVLMAQLSDTNPDQPETLIVSFETPAYSLDQAKALITQILSTFMFTSTESSWQQKSLELYSIKLSVPQEWQLVEYNRRNAPEDPSGPDLQHDCADYRLTSPDSSVTLLINPICGFADGGSSPWPTNAVIVKTLTPPQVIIRYWDPQANKYFYSSAWDSEGTGGTPEGKVHSSPPVISVGNGANLTFLKVSLTYTGTTSNLSTNLDLSDKIIASIQQ